MTKTNVLSDKALLRLKNPPRNDKTRREKQQNEGVDKTQKSKPRDVRQGPLTSKQPIDLITQRTKLAIHGK